MPRTLSRNILGLLRFLGVDVSGRGAQVSDDVQLGLPLSEFTDAALIPHFGVRFGVGLVPAGRLAAYRVTAPPDRGVRILHLHNVEASLIQISINAIDAPGTFTPQTNPFTTWNGVPLANVQRGSMTIPVPFGFMAFLNNISGFGATARHGDIISPHPLWVPPGNFFYITSTAANGACGGSLIFSEPIPTNPVRTQGLTSHG